ncbi:helicase C-terminal domain-containing protein [Gottfriedia solisilvae]|uniref:ATP-dependent helicase n=1 Tax=Gottfriedia solisilvae TaxID=1516104 RepID=A0A8J3AP59_9BACI|nr:helicase C-terminal domain-containing protein [Gottfriedia solisilvae]GGI13893.1 ATP-dependent helicase [Gottfriedia solisilvae]
MGNLIKVSVRSLVEYAHKSGSIDIGYQNTVSLVDGTKAHQKIQNLYNESDFKERMTSGTIKYEDLTFQIEGRCDGLLFRDEKYIIEEIKSTAKDVSLYDENSYPVHWAQAKVYGYLICKELNLEHISIQLTYVNIHTEEKKRFLLAFSQQELYKFVQNVIKIYYPFAKWKYDHIEKRNDSIKELRFPFPSFRNGQRKLAGAVYQSIQDGNNLFAVAPTGIGKTVSTIFPAVKAIGDATTNKLFYLTSKTITRTVAEEAFGRMTEQGLCMSCTTLTAKDKICFKEETICDKDYCEFANGYYDRINEAVLDILSNEKLLSREKIEAYARKHTVCPFEYSLDLTNTADAIICDVNYIFDPRVSLKRLFDEHKRNSVLLIDEAHNLVDRGRDMYSSSLYKSKFLELKRQYKGINVALVESVSLINQSFINLRKKWQDQKMPVWGNLDDEFVDLIRAFVEIAELSLPDEEDPDRKQLLLDTYFESQNFLKIASYYDEKYVSYLEMFKSEVHMKLFCIDPSTIVNDVIKKFHSTIYFSATLTPLQYFQDMLGDIERDYTIKIDSPFSKEQLKVEVNPISTRFNDRSKTLDQLVSSIYENIRAKKGNYLVFFPSYQYLSQSVELFNEKYSDVKIIVQENGMTEVEREDFLLKFDQNNAETLVGFAVLGGIFSEGIDLKGDRLNGVVVVGVGLPQLCLERNILRDHFNEVGKNGYYYSYVFPGMNKVMQAGGRVIRSEDDEGSLLLIDDRYQSMLYQNLLPDEWK